MTRMSKAARDAKLTQVFEAAHAEGRAVMTHLEFELAASVRGLARIDIQEALIAQDLRKGITGYWLREAADPGAVAVMRAAMGERDADSEDEAA